MSSLYNVNNTEDVNDMNNDNIQFSVDTIRNLFLNRSSKKTHAMTGGSYNNNEDDEYKMKYYKYKTKYLKSTGKK